MMNNVVSFDKSANALKHRRRAELESSISSLVGDTLPRLLSDLFEHLDDDLFDSADRSSSDQQASVYFEAMRELRKQRSAIESGFIASVKRQLQAFWQNGVSEVQVAVDPDSDGLSLVGEAELEEKLAVAGVVSKAENRYHRELFALNLRLGHLSGSGEISVAENPIGPLQLTEHFAEALAQWPGELKVRLVVFKLFQRHVMEFVGGLYDEINDLLVAANVLPRLTQRIRRNPVAPSVQRARHQEPPAGTQKGTSVQTAAAEISEADLEALQLYRQLAGALGFSGLAGNGQAGSGARVFPPAELLDALGRFQREQLDDVLHGARTPHEVQESIREALRAQLELEGADGLTRQFSEAQKYRIDAVDLLFQFLLDDRNLPEPMRVLLGRLQIPVMRVALVDPDFFSDRDHPTRRLLNTLASAAVGWQDDGDRTERSLYGRVESVVRRVISGYKDDLSVFSELEQEFSGLLEKERRSAALAEERASQQLRSQEHLKMARVKVARVLARWIMPDSTLPMSARQLLVEGWKDVMMLAYLREGEHSEAWKRSVELAERLVWSVSPKEEADERKELLKAIPELLRELKEGLAAISYDQFRATRLFKELQTCHIASLRGDIPAEPALQADSALSATEESLLSATDDISEQPLHLDDSVSAAIALEVGDWLQWRNHEGQWVRGKLSWKSQVSGTYLFVNRHGSKIAEVHLQQLASMLKEGKAEALKRVKQPLVERTLETMASALDQHQG